jgi:hypothetical protein
VLRPVREAMGASSDVAAVFPPAMIEFFTARGISLKDLTLQILFTCTFLIMLVLQPVYGWLVSRFRAGCSCRWCTLLHRHPAGVLRDVRQRCPAGHGVLPWITVFNLFAVAVFWSFMADVYDNVEARRYYGYIGAAGTLGAIFGRCSRAPGGAGRHRQPDAGLGGLPAAVHRLPAAPAPCACSEAQRNRSAAKCRWAGSAGGPEADRARTVAALARC